MTDTVVFPQNRTCPYQPAPAYLPLAEQRPLAQVALYDGRRVWAVTYRDVARRLLGDPRISSDRTDPAWPMMFPSIAAAVGDVQQKVMKIVTALVGVDGPVHNARRKMMIPSFTMKRINALRPEIQEIVDALTPPPAPPEEPEEEEEVADDPNRQLTAADLDVVYDAPRGLVLHRTKKGDRWFAPQRDPRTGQPQTFELHPSEIQQLQTQLQGSPFWVLGAGMQG